MTLSHHPQDHVKGATICNIVESQGLVILELLTAEDDPLMRYGHSLQFLDLLLDFQNIVGRVDTPDSDCVPRQRFDIDIHVRLGSDGNGMPRDKEKSSKE